jgi:uncharacterized phage protein (TIGR01671 family)
MRQIKFRGKETSKPNRWMIGHYYEENGASFIWVKGEMKNWPIEVDAETVGQFTGLLDKNGKEIYEGDIILLGKNKTYTAQIVYRNDSLRIYSVGGYFIGDLDYIRQCGIEYCEVIGNIIDNPELLTETK